MQAFLAKFYETVIIALAVFLLLAISAIGVQSWRVNHFKSEFALLNTKYKTEVAEAKALAEQAKASAALKEKQWSEQQLKAELNYNAKIKQIESDSRLAIASADSLSKQLKIASSRLSSSSCKAKTEYIEIESNVLSYCVREYTKMAEQADAERVDKEKLDEA
ncbi:hypothetical protein [Acinetobacter bereziniae]|uniref:hypothetical protein n=1 Tax=Acinetobacter bereziniae TaxID=106648 RepID=UPI0015DA1991|nr:hypothetical protein [Acinetobacter bereziniae]